MTAVFRKIYIFRRKYTCFFIFLTFFCVSFLQFWAPFCKLDMGYIPFYRWNVKITQIECQDVLESFSEKSKCGRANNNDFGNGFQRTTPTGPRAKRRILLRHGTSRKAEALQFL